MASSSKLQKVLAKKPHRNSSENFLSKANEDSFPRVIRGNDLDEHVARVSGLLRNAQLIQHVLRTSIIPKAGDRVNTTPLLSMVTFLIMSNKPIDEAQLILDYLYGLSEIGHAEHKRKRNIALGRLVNYVLENKYNLFYPDQEYEELLYYNDGSFRAIFKEESGKSHVISDIEEEPEGAPAPANELNYQYLVQRFDRLETHFDQRFDQIETHLQQQAAQYQHDMGFTREQMNDISTNVLMMSIYFNIFGGVVVPPPPLDQGPSE
ncbi:hypothetical protein MA16_Dca001179 [Dendrobium catenatum]|uniref:Uncharacterized protein n=1 Tax=Dendrobium catenatum TaxID=906689 RepID=A0A2I0WLP0_9ASPA|nr:hypothetical protein MA16_Dca001179 [Dendrobium catenatum]